MSILDWSDAEEMLGLLADYVRDELKDEHEDRERVRFLRALSSSVDAISTDAHTPASTALDRLREIYAEQPSEFAGDPVLQHVDDCIEELARIVNA